MWVNINNDGGRVNLDQCVSITIGIVSGSPPTYRLQANTAHGEGYTLAGSDYASVADAEAAINDLLVDGS